MALSRNAINWDQLKPRILWDLANGKTQQQIRQELAEDPSRVSISKSQLETQLKRWKYRNSLHEQEWKVVSHRINKRRKAGKATSQVLVNGFIFNERKVAKAMSRYDTPTLAYRLPPPQIPPELSHHLIEVRTPPPSYCSLQLPPSMGAVAQTSQESLTLYLTSVKNVWPRTAQWKKVELSVGQFVTRFFLPTYEQDERFRDAISSFGHESPVPQNDRSQKMLASPATYKKSLTAQACDASVNPYYDVPVHRYEMQRSFGGSQIHEAVIRSLVGLLYGLSNQSLGDTGRKALASIMDAPAWDTVLPRLRDVLAMIDSKIVQAIAEGLLKESIQTFNHSMLDLSLGLGANPTQHIRCFDRYGHRDGLSTPLVAICYQYSRISGYARKMDSPEKLILSLLKRDSHVSNSALLWIIGVNCHAIAEGVIRSQPQRPIDFEIAVADLGGQIRLDLEKFGLVTPLLVACSDRRQSAQKLSLIRCLLERNANADLKAMLAAAGACDGEVIYLLYQHGAPVNGFIPKLGSPLSCACETAVHPPVRHRDFTAIPLLLRLGTSPNNPKIQDLNEWDFSPLHILAHAEERPEVTETLDLLLKYGADVNHRGTYYQSDGLPGYSRSHGPLAQTALECAIQRSRWISALQFLSAGCELTGRELLFFSSTGDYRGRVSGEIRQDRFRHLIGALLTKTPEQATALRWNGLTVLQRAIQNEYEDMILALFAFGVSPMPSDFLYMFCNKKDEWTTPCPLSSSTQMKLILPANLHEPPITKSSTVRLILAFACPEVVRHILNGRPDVYDSEGLCHVIARVVTRETSTHYEHEEEDHEPDCLTVDDLRALISRRTISNRLEDWESTAIVLTARAGRADILRILIEPGQEGVPSSGLIPLFLLKEVLTSDWNTIRPTGAHCDELYFEEYNSEFLCDWIKYCRMDDPNIKCSPLTAAAMVLPETAAEEIVDLLLSLNYEPDGWTVLVACCKGHLSILQRLKRLDCWLHILSHADRPGWCPTALQTAVYNSHLSIVRFLLSTVTTIAEVDLSPDQPFCFVRLGVGFTSNDAQTILPKTALQHAVDKENMEVVTLLVNAGANVNAPAAMNSGATALQIASIQGSIPMMEYLISQGADPYAAGAARHGRTAIQGAAEHGRKDAVELLLSQSQLITHQYREQLVEAIFYAEKNAQHVVAGILRETILPPWSSDDEKTFEMLSEDWENSSRNSEYYELRNEIEAWDLTLEDWSESLQAYETTTNADVMGEQPFIENPLASQENDSCVLHEMEFGDDCHEGLHAGQLGQIDLYDGDVVSSLALQENTTAWVEKQPSLERFG